MPRGLGQDGCRTSLGGQKTPRSGRRTKRSSWSGHRDGAKRSSWSPHVVELGFQVIQGLSGATQSSGRTVFDRFFLRRRLLGYATHVRIFVPFQLTSHHADSTNARYIVMLKFWMQQFAFYGNRVMGFLFRDVSKAQNIML